MGKSTLKTDIFCLFTAFNWTIFNTKSAFENRKIYGLNSTFSASSSITNLNCVFISHTHTQKWCDYYNKNIVLLDKYWFKFSFLDLFRHIFAGVCAKVLYLLFSPNSTFFTMFTTKRIFPKPGIIMYDLHLLIETVCSCSFY